MDSLEFQDSVRSRRQGPLFGAASDKEEIHEEVHGTQSLQEHWERIYTSYASDTPAWGQLRPSPSIEWISEFLPYRRVSILDAGGGASLLVDHLLASGYQRPAVLDISPAALAIAKARLAEKRNLVQWIETDITCFRAAQPYSLWHDRGLFHYLTERSDRRAYGHALWSSLLPGGLAIIATYAPDGPTECSGLPVTGYDPQSLANELGPAFRLRIGQRILHLGPGGERRDFTYALFEKN